MIPETTADHIGTFKPETEWLLALDKYPSDKGNEYEVSICGEFFLPVNDGISVGNVTSMDPEAEKKSLN